MMRLKFWFCSFLDDEEGATATEYAIMIVLILLVAFAAIILLGTQVEQGFNTFVTEFNAAQGS